MVAAPTPPRAEEQPVLTEPPSGNKSFEENLEEARALLAEARLLFEELKEADPP